MTVLGLKHNHPLSSDRRTRGGGSHGVVRRDGNDGREGQLVGGCAPFLRSPLQILEIRERSTWNIFASSPRSQHPIKSDRELASRSNPRQCIQLLPTEAVRLALLCWQPNDCASTDFQVPKELVVLPNLENNVLLSNFQLWCIDSDDVCCHEFRISSRV